MRARGGRRLAVLDSLGRTSYPHQWGFHPYVDVRRERQNLVNIGTQAFITAIGRDQRVSFSEAGSRIDFAGQARPRNTLATQARELRYLIDRLALYRRRVDRVYYYQFCAGRSHVHDSGLTGGPETMMPTFPDCTEGPRPAYVTTSSERF